LAAFFDRDCPPLHFGVPQPRDLDHATRPPAFGERRHRGLARRFVTVSRAAHVAVVATRSHLLPVRWGDRHLENAADDEAKGEALPVFTSRLISD